MATFQKRPVQVEIRRAEEGETVETREGTLTAEDGDLIITGVEGEVYPIGPRILAKTYLPVDDEARDLYRECLPEGVVVEFESKSVPPNGGTATFVSGIWIDGPLDEDERIEAEQFAREFIRASPHLSGEVPYTL